jgi:CheY-like chemotaxis protein/HPt (histidine-containing phosphotransfer) domain-containing protein
MPTAAADQGGLKGVVLLAEDNPVNQEVAKALLAKLGLRVDIAYNGAEALALSEAHRYDVILMDCQMPVMDGFQATAAIRQREGVSGRVPIVALTANAMEGDRNKCLAAGMDDYLSKPYSRAQLAEVLGRWLPADGDAGPGAEAIAVLQEREPNRSMDGDERASALNMGFLDQFRELDPTGGLSLVKDIMRVYLDTTPAMLPQVEQAVAAEDGEALRRAAHFLKSSSANVGADRLAELFRRLEVMGRERELAEAKSLLDPMRRAYDDATVAIRRVMAEG